MAYYAHREHWKSIYRFLQSRSKIEIEYASHKVTPSNKSAVIARLNNAKSDIIDAKDCLIVVIDVLDIEDEDELLNDLLEDFEELMDEIDEKLDSIAAV